MMPEKVEIDVRRQKARLGGGRALVAFLLLLLLGALAWRSYHQTYVIAGFGSGGKIGGVISLRGQVMLVLTNIQMGEDRAWTIQAASTSVIEGDRLVREMLEGANAKVTRHWNFSAARHAKDAFGFPGCWCVSLGVPHWALMPLLAWPVVGWGRRTLRLRQWKQQGKCQNCGYDLRGSAERCPECGRAA